MGSPFSPTLDETHCLRPLCSHTCCWEAEQHVWKGKPRQLKALTLSRTSAAASEEGRFPAITVVNALVWPDAAEVHPLKSEDDFSETAANTLISQAALSKGARRQENVQNPKFSFVVPSHPETHRENKTVKLKTVHISPLPSYTSTSQSSKSILMQFPKSCAESPRQAVKELTFFPSAEMTKSVANKKKLKQDKSRKRAPLKQTSWRSRLNQEGKGPLKSEAGTDPSDPGLSWPGSDRELQVKKASAPPQVHRLVPVGQTVSAAPEAKDEQQPPRSTQSLHLRNNPRVFQSVGERIQRRHTQEEHHTSKYRLDLKTGMDGTDWESLKRQTSLWRRQTQPGTSGCGRPSSSEDKMDYVPYCLHPIPSSHCQSKNSSFTGPDKQKIMNYVNGIWQSYCLFLASTSMDGRLRKDNFRFWFSTCFLQNPGQYKHLRCLADAESELSPPSSLISDICEEGRQ